MALYIQARVVMPSPTPSKASSRSSLSSVPASTTLYALKRIRVGHRLHMTPAYHLSITIYNVVSGWTFRIYISASPGGSETSSRRVAESHDTLSCVTGMFFPTTASEMSSVTSSPAAAGRTPGLRSWVEDGTVKTTHADALSESRTRHQTRRRKITTIGVHIERLVSTYAKKSSISMNDAYMFLQEL